ncbi:MAG: hypothetical protein HYY11_04680 [Candidatus Methylomirabilis oxyfera]|nr:hypothetical protein [Candidatus Methylomirabilis oxyfera]
MMKVQRGAVILVGGTSYPCDVKSCVALRGSIYPLPCAQYYRDEGGAGEEFDSFNCAWTSGSGGSA